MKEHTAVAFVAFKGRCAASGCLSGYHGRPDQTRNFSEPFHLAPASSFREGHGEGDEGQPRRRGNALRRQGLLGGVWFFPRACAPPLRVQRPPEALPRAHSSKPFRSVPAAGSGSEPGSEKKTEKTRLGREKWGCAWIGGVAAAAVARSPSRGSEKGIFPRAGRSTTWKREAQGGFSSVAGMGQLKNDLQEEGAGASSSFLLVKEAGSLARDLGASPQLFCFSL